MRKCRRIAQKINQAGYKIITDKCSSKNSSYNQKEIRKLLDMDSGDQTSIPAVNSEVVISFLLKSLKHC